MGRVLRTLRRTALQAVPTVIAIVVIDFFLLRLAPGDAADALAAESGSATEETMAALRRISDSTSRRSQFFAYVGHLLHFRLGFSPLYNMPVSRLIEQRLPASLLLMVTALSLALVIGITAGMVMSAFAGRTTGPGSVHHRVAVLFRSRILDRPDADRCIFRLARLAAERGCRNDRLRPHGLSLAAGSGKASDPAGVLLGTVLHRHLRPPGARFDAGSARSGLCSAPRWPRV